MARRTVRSTLLALAAFLVAAPHAGATVFTLTSSRFFSLPGPIIGYLRPVTAVPDLCTGLGWCAHDALVFRVQLTGGAIEEVRATVTGPVIGNGIGYTGLGVGPDGVGFVNIGETARWFWPTNLLLAGQRSSKLIVVFPAGALPGTPGEVSFDFDDASDVPVMGPQGVAIAPAPPCGDGTQTAIEECDDGNTLEDDCCSAACEFEPNGHVCADDGDPCSGDQCNGSGTCVHQFPEHLGCIFQAPFRSTLAVRSSSDPGRRRLSWKWKNATGFDPDLLGDPTTASGYRLCVGDSTGAVKVSAVIPPGGTCLGGDCWDQIRDGFRYTDITTSEDGILLALLKAGTPGRGKVIVRGRGANLNLSTPIVAPVRARIIRSDLPICFEATYPTALQSTGTSFRARSN
jgi:cysteine-rich repeat protein